MSKFKVGDKVKVISDYITNDIYKIYDIEIRDDVNFYGLGGYNIYTDDDLELYKTPQERLFELGFEKVAKHKYIKHHKGGIGYDTPYKITIEFAFNSYQVKCEGENWGGVDLELAEILLDYLEELKYE